MLQLAHQLVSNHEGVRRIALAELIVPAGKRIRFEESKEEMQQLVSSIEVSGLLQPLLVRTLGDQYELIAGARRLEACKHLGLTSVDAVIVNVSEKEAFLLSLVENLQRRELHYFEEAQGYARAIEEYKLTQDELSKRVGKSQSAIANKLRLLRLTVKERDALKKAKLSERHARAILPLGQEEERLRVIDLCVQHELSVQKTEQLVKQMIKDKGELDECARRVILVMRDQRLYINAIRDIVSQMNASGIGANMTLKDVGDGLEMRVLIPRSKEKNR